MAYAGYDDELNRKSAVTGFFTNVDHFIRDREAGIDDYVGERKEITKRHWRPASTCQKCSNPSCQRVFTAVFERPHHCRKCGEVFCNNCIQYKRRLNNLAHFDTDGQLYKVCKTCFEKGVLTDGYSRSHTSDFLLLRSAFRRRSLTSGTESASSIWRSKTIFSKECQRLIDGFASSISKSEIMKTLYEMKNVVSAPEWIKSSVWMLENTVSKCRVCVESFSLMKKKQFCSVCGTAVCKMCSSKDLLLYVPDDAKNGGAARQVKMAIIRIVGCPEVEPEISLHLRVCPTCKEKLISQQVEEAEEEEQSEDLVWDFMSTLEKLHCKFHKAEEGVRKQLPNYTNVVESLEDGSRKTPEQSNMKILAKAQEDLADALANHVTLVQQLKKLSPSTPTQSSLLKTYIRAKCEFYLDNMSSFRLLKSKLSNSVPAESLDFIQRIMDKNAIISTHLALRQLVYEVLHLTQSHQVETDLPASLVSVEQDIETEVKKCLIKGGENVEEHMELVKDMTRLAIKDHKLIRISRRALKTKGKQHLHKFILSRCDDILNQVVNQLQLASANRSFQLGKSSLDEVLTNVKERKENVGKERGVEEGFVIVDKNLL